MHGEAGVAGGVAALGVGQDGGGFAGGVRSEGEPGFGGQGAEDGGELGRGAAGEVDDGGEPGGQRRGGVQHVAERAGLAGQDDSEEDIRVTLQQIGAWKGGLFERSDDVCSIAYCYQSSGSVNRVPLVPSHLRRPR